MHSLSLQVHCGPEVGGHILKEKTKKSHTKKNGIKSTLLSIAPLHVMPNINSEFQIFCINFLTASCKHKLSTHYAYSSVL